MGHGIPASSGGRKRKTVRQVKSPRGGNPGAKDRTGERSGGGGPTDPSLEALALIRKGIPVFPCKRSKAPYTRKGFLDATTDEAQVRAWWLAWPDALVGVPTGRTSGFNVLDIDVKDGTPEQVLARAPERPPRTRVHVTRSGGRHYLYDATEPVRSRQGVFPGADTRGDGGYIIWWPAHGFDAEVRTLAPTPAWLASAPAPKTSASVTLMPGVPPVTWEGEKKLIRERLRKMNPDCGYEAWYKVGAALYHESNGSPEGLTIWDAWSAGGTKYKQGECDIKWRSFKTDREDRITWSGAESAVEADEAPPPPSGMPKGIARLSDIYERPDAPMNYILDGAFKIPAGAWLLAGKPKDGKTWLAMNIMASVATGREYLKSRPPRGPGGVIYINLDDGNDARFSRRAKAMGIDAESAHNIMHITHVDTDHFDTAYQMAEAMLTATTGIRLMVIDTLGTFRTNERKEGVYQQEYGELRQINELARTHGVLILIVHHFRKGEVNPEYPFESISGTLGIQGGVDGMIVMMRKDAQHPSDPAQDERLAALWYRGRDVDHDGDIGMRLSDGVWSIIGSTGDVLVGNTLREVMRVLKAEPGRWFTSKEVTAEIDGGKHETVRKALQRAARSRRIDSRPGRDGGYRWREPEK
ncbi:MAG: bifunctional DNA primase/polymerase [Candidatus Nanopelagicales bacterium]